jgi:hypothetical protein
VAPIFIVEERETLIPSYHTERCHGTAVRRSSIKILYSLVFVHIIIAQQNISF